MVQRDHRAGVKAATPALGAHRSTYVLLLFPAYAAWPMSHADKHVIIRLAHSPNWFDLLCLH